MIEWVKNIICHIGWHGPIVDKHKDPKDPLQFLDFGKCKWCGYEGQIDGQGNLF